MSKLSTLPRIKLMCYDCNDEFTARGERCWKLWDDGALRPICRSCQADQEKEYKRETNGPWRIPLTLINSSSGTDDDDNKAIAQDIEDQVVSAVSGNGNKADRYYFPPGTR